MQNLARLDQTIRDLQKRFGDHALTQLADYREAQSLPSGFPILDQVLGCGGLPCGRVTAFCGQASAGRTTLAQRVVAHIQREMDVIAYVDLGSTFDAEGAADCGVDLDRLLLVQPDGLSLLPDLVGTLVALHVDLIVLDASAALRPVTVPDWLAAEIARGRSAVLMLPPFGQTPTTDHAAIRLLVERVEWLRRAEVSGFRSRVTVLESRCAPPGGQVLLDLLLGEP